MKRTRPPDDLCHFENRIKFSRRTDLTPSIRMHIAFSALEAQAIGYWGRITELSRQFKISRTFVYMLAATMVQVSDVAFGAGAIQPAGSSEFKESLRWMLSLRLEGRCSIEAESTIMRRFNVPRASVGSISQTLTQIGSMLPNTVSTHGDEPQVLVFLSDEIFSKSTPILVTVDPISSVILRIEIADSRKADEWRNHWKCIEENGYFAAYLVCDEGKGLCTAKEDALPDIFRQADTQCH